MISQIQLLFMGLLLVTAMTTNAATLPANAKEFENEHLKLVLIPRTPDQMAAFYEARGFPGNALSVISNLCFITVGIKNKRRDILWLNLDNWSFYTNNSYIRRIHRSEWPERWNKLEVPQRLQSTFRWTLLPETLDFRPDENEGGNIILPRITGSFSLVAKFLTGADKQGKEIRIQLNDLACAEDES